MITRIDDRPYSGRKFIVRALALRELARDAAARGDVHRAVDLRRQALTVLARGA